MSSNTTTTTASAPASASNVSKTAVTSTPSTGYRTPDQTTMQHACNMAMTHDKPILLDYWMSSIDKTALIGVKEEDGEKLLVKSAEEYTSPIVKIFKVSNEYIVITENSIYIVDVNIPTKRIST
jgi:hypothetical protein